MGLALDQKPPRIVSQSAFNSQPNLPMLQLWVLLGMIFLAWAREAIGIGAWLIGIVVGILDRMGISLIAQMASRWDESSREHAGMSAAFTC